MTVDGSVDQGRRCGSYQRPEPESVASMEEQHEQEAEGERHTSSSMTGLVLRGTS